MLLYYPQNNDRLDLIAGKVYTDTNLEIGIATLVDANFDKGDLLLLSAASPPLAYPESPYTFENTYEVVEIPNELG